MTPSAASRQPHGHASAAVSDGAPPDTRHLLGCPARSGCGLQQAGRGPEGAAIQKARLDWEEAATPHAVRTHLLFPLPNLVSRASTSERLLRGTEFPLRWCEGSGIQAPNWVACLISSFPAFALMSSFPALGHRGNWVGDVSGSCFSLRGSFPRAGSPQWGPPAQVQSLPSSLSPAGRPVCTGVLKGG